MQQNAPCTPLSLVFPQQQYANTSDNEDDQTCKHWECVVNGEESAAEQRCDHSTSVKEQLVLGGVDMKIGRTFERVQMLSRMRCREL